MKQLITEFLEDLVVSRSYSTNTIKSYQRDLAVFEIFFENITLADIGIENIEFFIVKLRKDGKKIILLDAIYLQFQVFINF